MMAARRPPTTNPCEIEEDKHEDDHEGEDDAEAFHDCISGDEAERSPTKEQQLHHFQQEQQHEQQQQEQQQQQHHQLLQHRQTIEQCFLTSEQVESPSKLEAA